MMRILNNAIGLARATGKPLAAVRYLAFCWRDQAVLIGCVVAVIIVNQWGM